MKRLLSILLLIAAFVPVAKAQSDLPEDKKAIFCVDIQVNKLLESELADSLGDEMVGQILKGMDLPIEGKKFTRIYGLIGGPDSLDEMMGTAPSEKMEVTDPSLDGSGTKEALDGSGTKEAMEDFEDGGFEDGEFNGQPDVPLNLLFEFKVVDASAAKELFQSMSLDENSGQEINGVTYYSPPRFAPQNLVGGIVDETTVVFGTKEFVFAEGSRKNLFSRELQKTWSRSQQDLPLRASLELVSKAAMISEAIEAVEESGDLKFILPFDPAPMLSMIGNVESINLSADLSGPELLAIRGFGKDDAGAEDLRTNLNGLLGIAKIMGGGMKPQLQELPNASTMMDGLLKDLNTTGEGREVNLVIGRPEKFEEGISELLVMAREQAQISIRQNNLRQVLLAVHNYETSLGKFPFEEGEDKKSWREELEPHLFHFSVEGEMPDVYGSDGENSMIALVRSNPIPKDFGDIRDGTTNTICMVEVKTGIPWKSNQDITPDQVVEMVKNLEEGEVIFAARYDASLMTLTSETDLETLKAMLTPAGGEAVEAIR